MSGLYKDKKDCLADVISANSTKVFSQKLDGKFVPASSYERNIHKEESAAATARLAINKAMTEI